MPKKYLKSKDGKFNGSLPDPSSLPRAASVGLDVPVLPTSVETPESAIPSAEDLNLVGITSQPILHITKNIYPGDMRAYYEIAGNSELSGNVMVNNNGTFTSTIETSSYGETKELIKTVHGSSREAENKVRNELNRLGGYIKSFEDVLAEGGISSLSQKIEAATNSDPNWLSQIDTSFGPPTAWMKSGKTNRGATVQRYKNGYYVSLFEYSTIWDKEGTLFLTKEFPDFDKSYAFASFVVSGLSDSLTNK